MIFSIVIHDDTTFQIEVTDATLLTGIGQARDRRNETLPATVDGDPNSDLFASGDAGLQQYMQFVLGSHYDGKPLPTSDEITAVFTRAARSYAGLPTEDAPVETPVPEVVALTKEALSAYNLAKFNAIEAAGTTVDITPGDTPTVVHMSTNASGKVDVAVLNLEMMQVGPTWTSPWYQSTGILSINATQLGIISAHLKQFTLDLLAAWTVAETGINSGSITTKSEIDALDWPS